jgi:hypothetical protein
MDRWIRANWQIEVIYLDTDLRRKEEVPRYTSDMFYGGRLILGLILKVHSESEVTIALETTLKI